METIGIPFMSNGMPLALKTFITVSAYGTRS